MRGHACMLLMALACLLPSGCAVFGKKRDSTGSSSPGFFSKLGKQPAKFPTAPDPMFPGTANPPPTAIPTSSTSTDQAILAGHVINASNRAPANTFIRWVSIEDNKETGAPIDVAVSPEGYFTIQGLKPDTRYKLIARSKQGDKLFAGITYTQAPNVRVVIQVKEEFASSAPATPAATPPAEEKKTSALNQPGLPGATTIGAFNAAVAPAIPSPGSVGFPGNEHNLPSAMNIPANPNPTAAVQAIPQAVPATPATPSWTASPGAANATNTGNVSTWPPTLEIKPRRSDPGVPTTAPQPPPLTQRESKLNLPATRVPSCVVVGNQLFNLALNDVNGSKWEFRNDRRGRLVLLDFWGTGCLPCRQTMPELQRLHSQYSGNGLEVVGVAFEEGSLEQQGYAVRQVCGRLNITYRQLLGEPKKSDIRRQFNADMIPTLILVNESGVILWRHTGRPDASSLQELERLLNQRLGSQAF